MPTCRAEATSALTGCDVRGHKARTLSGHAPPLHRHASPRPPPLPQVLVIGAGGIGCELVKNLVLSGFERITMVDLDTIDYSNLNRQFLFRAKHVGRSKAHVARESVLDFPHDEGIEITSKHGNVKSQEFTFEYFRSFSIVLNALDNVEARRHVNRICLSAEVPLIESGTQGYLGQVCSLAWCSFHRSSGDASPHKYRLRATSNRDSSSLRLIIGASHPQGQDAVLRVRSSTTPEIIPHLYHSQSPRQASSLHPLVQGAAVQKDIWGASKHLSCAHTAESSRVVKSFKSSRPLRN